MVAAYDAQFGTPTPEAPKTPAVVPGTEAPAVDPNAPVPKLTDEVPKTPEEIAAAAAAEAAKPKEGEEATKVPALAELFESGDFMAGIAAETIPENLTKAFEAAGFKPEQVAAINERMRQLVALETQVNTEKLYVAAGGKEQFAALVKWGQANMTVEQRAYYDTELNGPNAAEAIAVLTARMNKGSDPRLTTVSANVNPPVLTFQSSAEMQAAMRDPRYQNDPAYRNSVAERLRHARF